MLDDVRSGLRSPDEALQSLRRFPSADLGFATVDHHRHLRQGMAEAVYGPGKQPDHCASIVRELLDASDTTPVLPPPPSPAQLEATLALTPGGEVSAIPPAATVVWRSAPPRPERIVVATAG